MKLSNCVAGVRIEAKRDVVGINDGIIPKGLQVVVGKIQIPAIDACPVRVDHSSFDRGYEWVNPADFRKVKEVEQGDAVPADVQKGTKVVCVRGFVSNVSRYDVYTVGTVYTVRVTGVDDDGDLRLEHPSLGGGHGFGKPQNFRLYKEPQEAVVPKQPVLTEECTTQNLEVGDTVLVGAEGAGYGYVDPALAGKVCTVSAVDVSKGEPDLLRIAHPDVCPRGYSTYSKYLTKVVKEPVVEPEPVVQEFQEGDVLECITDCEGKHAEKCVAGRVYKYLRDSIYPDSILVGDPELWYGAAAVLPENFKLYARPVKDCTDADTPTA